jgi:hypothetical protein
MALPALLIAVLVCGPAGCTHQGPAREKGEHVEIDDKTGLIKYWVEGKGGLVVGDATGKFAVALPYSDSWRFTRNVGQPLRGNAGPYNVTVEIVRRALSPAAYLDEWMATLRRDIPGAVATLVPTEQGVLLRADVDVATIPGGEKFRGTHQLHLLTARRSVEGLYTLHFSVIGPPTEIEALEPQLRKNVRAFLDPK